MEAERTVLLTGASGFVGSHLGPELENAGYRVRAMTRRPEQYRGAGEPIAGDLNDPASLTKALAGVAVAYYLAHALDSNDFARRDAQAATAFVRAAADAGVEQIIYLGGLGRDDTKLSEHLRSRREVEHILASTDVPVTTLRAAVVVGHGGISWEITRQLVAHLPIMITPSWTGTRTQPIALPDIIRYLVGVLDNPGALGRTFDVGGPDVLRYSDMLRRAARQYNDRPLPMLPVPLLSPKLSAFWLAFVTDVNLTTARNLVNSITNEVVVRDGDAILELIPGDRIGYDESVRLALAERTRALDTALAAS